MQVNGLSPLNAQHIAASVFINNDERGLHQDYDDWLEELALHEPVSIYCHNRPGEVCPDCSEGTTPTRT